MSRQLYGKRAAWEDPSKWVNDTYPWSSTSLQHDCQALLQLRPEDVGYDGYTSSKEGASSKQVSQSDTEGDPLVRCQEKAPTFYCREVRVQEVTLRQYICAPPLDRVI